MKELAARLGGVYTASAGTVYPNLRLLEVEKVRRILGKAAAEIEKLKE